MNTHRSLVAGALLSLHAQTSLHAGSGLGLGTVDLPIQRERHTQWPYVPGSSLKGILREACREREQRSEVPSSAVVKLFGSPASDSPLDPENSGSLAAGALSLTDARLLAFPVRSLKGVFAWTTCPAALERFRRDAALAGFSVPWTIPEPPAHGAVAAPNSPCLIEGDRLILEEYDFPAKIESSASDVAGWIARFLLSDDPAYASAVARFGRQTVILTDDDFTHFTRHATEVVARIGLNHETKTVRKGALFHQEFLPPETLLYSVVLANPVRSLRTGAATLESKGEELDGAAILNLLDSLTPSPMILQVGGEESIGKGYCTAKIIRACAESEQA